VFDIRDDLRTVQMGGSTVGQFLYDYQGLRIEKLGERGAERSTYDDQSILQPYDVAAEETRETRDVVPRETRDVPRLTVRPVVAMQFSH